MNVWLWIAVLVVAVVAAVVITYWLTLRHDTKKVSFMMDALEDGELNSRFLDNSTMNRIRGIFEQRIAVNEETSWNKLFRVMTHEIMNTVAPIASLSDMLINEENVDMKAGLETISASSKDLIRFVESYRSLTQAQPPVRKAVMVDELMEHVLLLNKVKISEQGATLTYQAMSDSQVTIFAMIFK